MVLCVCACALYCVLAVWASWRVRYVVACDMLKRRPWSKSEPTLLVGNGEDVRQLNAVTGHQVVTCDVEVGRAVAVDFDNANNAIFWTDVRHQNITRSLDVLAVFSPDIWGP